MVSFKRARHIIVAVTALGGAVALDHVALAQEPAAAEAVQQGSREQQFRDSSKASCKS